MKNFIDLFTGLKRAHGCTYVEKKSSDGTKVKGKSFVKREPVTDKLWQDHLNGIEPSLGIIPIDENNQCRWGCIDVDKYNLNHKKIITLINNHQLPLTLCRSKSGGAHIFLFTTTPVTAKLMRDRLTSISAFLGFGNAEVFPKQVELKSEDDTGNFLNLPYFNSTKTTRYAFNFKGEAITISQFFLAVKRLTPEELEKLELKRPESEFKDGPPCIESLTQTKLKDGRDRVLYQYIQYAKRKWPEDWAERINHFNYTHFEIPLTDKIIQDKIRSNKKEFFYKCNEEPMCSHCDKELCKTRTYGIGGDTVFPMLTDLQKILLDTPYYYVNVDGQRVRLENATVLYDQRLFQIAVLEQIDLILPTVKKTDWKKLIQKLLDGLEEIDPPAGSSKIDQLQNHLEEFCTNRSSTTTTKEDITRGNVYQSNKKYYFVFSRFFHGYLQKRKWDEKSQVTQRMLQEHFRCEEERMMIGKKKISVIVADSLERIEAPYKSKELKPKDPY